MASPQLVGPLVVLLRCQTDHGPQLASVLGDQRGDRQPQSQPAASSSTRRMVASSGYMSSRYKPDRGAGQGAARWSMERFVTVELVVVCARWLGVELLVVISAGSADVLE